MESYVVDATDESVSVCIGVSRWTLANGSLYLEEDYRVGGEVWRVHKNDPDPLPSRPHAHCIGGSRRFIGCKLHLGTRQLFTGNNKALDRFLDEGQFERLIEMVRRNFPDLNFPLL
jgi:hypothetical protein